MNLDTVVGIVGGGVFGIVLLALLMTFRHAVSEHVEASDTQRQHMSNAQLGRADRVMAETALEAVRVRSGPIRAPRR